MKLLMANYPWIGGTVGFVEKAFRKLGHEVKHCYFPVEKTKFLYKSKLSQVKKIESVFLHRLERKYNNYVMNTAMEFKPNLFFTLNSNNLFPETISYIKNNNKCIMACWVQDNPFDSSRFRFFPINLEYFDVLFVGDMIWEQNIRNVTPGSKIFHLVGAYSPEYFKPVSINAQEKETYGCNLAFAGSAYGMKAEGIYRIGILAQVADLGLKIWGDNAWNRSFKYYPGLKQVFQGGRLDFIELNKMYQITKINLNIPNPQCLTTFQQRTFEIAAAGGFQIVDYRKDINEYFNEDEIVTFKNINDLREKISYFLNNPEERKSYIEKAYIKVNGVHTYENRLKEMLEKIGSN